MNIKQDWTGLVLRHAALLPLRHGSSRLLRTAALLQLHAPPALLLLPTAHHDPPFLAGRVITSSARLQSSFQVAYAVEIEEEEEAGKCCATS
jgi:hypothetical protein